jgi:hypothetical protein
VEFLHDYVSIFPAIVAVINGALAVLLRHYPFKTRIAEFAFVAIIGLLSISAIGATSYSQHLVIAQKTEERARRNMIRDQLGEFIGQGIILLNLAATASSPLPTDTTNAWAASVENFLRSNLGNSYVIRFRDATGMPPLNPTGVDEEHQDLWRDIYSRMLRLEQFSQELPAS